MNGEWASNRDSVNAMLPFKRSTPPPIERIPLQNSSSSSSSKRPAYSNSILKPSIDGFNSFPLRAVETNLLQSVILREGLTIRSPLVLPVRLHIPSIRDCRVITVVDLLKEIATIKWVRWLNTKTLAPSLSPLPPPLTGNRNQSN